MTTSEKTLQSLLFFLWLTVFVRASRCASACHSSFLRCRYDNGLRSEGLFKGEKAASGYQNGEASGLKIICSLREARQKLLSRAQKGKLPHITGQQQCDIHNRSSNSKRSACQCPEKCLSTGRGEARDGLSTDPPSPAGRKAMISL